MNDSRISENGILLTFDEIRILLYNMGCQTLEGVRMPEKLYTEEEVLTAMQHMASTGLILAGAEKFTVREDLRDLLRIMALPLSTFRWQTGDGRECFCYVGEDTVVTSQKIPYRMETLRLCRYSLAEFMDRKEQEENDHY